MEKQIKFSSVIILTFLFTLFLTTQALGADWPMFGSDKGNTRYQPDETIITKDNVASLHVMWKTAPFSIQGGFIKTPVVDEGYVYLTTSSSLGGTSLVYKLNKSDGQPVFPPRDIRDVIRQCHPGETIPSSFDIQTSPALSNNDLVVTTIDSIPQPERFPSCPTVCLDTDGNPNTPCVLSLDPNLNPACYDSPKFPNGGGYVVVMDKNTFACKSATPVTDHPFEGILGSTTVVTINNGKGNMTHLAIVGISSNEEAA